MGEVNIQLLSWGVTRSFKFHSLRCERVSLPFPSRFFTVSIGDWHSDATSGPAAAVRNIHSIPLRKAEVPQVSCNSPVCCTSPASSFGTARAKLPEKQTALKREGTTESSQAGIEGCNSHLARCGSHSGFRSSREKGSRSHSPFRKQTTAGCYSRRQLSTHPYIKQVCCLHLTRLAMSTWIQGGSTRVKRIKEPGWQQQFLKAEPYKRSRG